MARDVSPVSPRRPHIRSFCLLLILLLSLAGCGSGPVPEPVTYEVRTDRLTPDAAAQPEGFAAHLAVEEEGVTFARLPAGAQAAVLYGVDDGAVLHAENSTERLYPASVTKLFTVYVALKHGTLTDVVTVPEEARIPIPDSSMCGVFPGDRMTLQDLIYGALFPSGNDACVAIAVHIAGSVEAFADLMNREMHALGCTGSHFVTPNGLHDPDHYTTAYDIYLVLDALAKDETFLSFFDSPTHTARYVTADGESASLTWTNTCRYLNGQRALPDGVTVEAAKTGTTTPAGYCLATLVSAKDGKKYVTVILKAGSRNGLYDDTDALLRRIP